MGVFWSAKARHAAASKEELFYGMAAQDLATNRPSTGLYAKAMVEAGGDAAKTSAIYIKLRVRALQLENLALREEAREQISAAEAVERALISHQAEVKLKEGESGRLATVALLLIIFVGAPSLCFLLAVYFSLI
jgi:hypothetical protein